MVEAIGTAIFISVVMQVAYFNKEAFGPYNAFAIAGTFYGMAKTTDGISGGCLNPVAGIVQTIIPKLT